MDAKLIFGVSLGFSFGVFLSICVLKKPKLKQKHARQEDIATSDLFSLLEDKTNQETTKVYLVGAGPGAVDLISLRGYVLLQLADVIIHDRLVSPQLLCCVKDGAKLINVGKAPKKDRFPQSEINKILIQEAKSSREGAIIVRLKGGDPFVFGLGGDEVLALSEASIEYEVVPGISSATAVPASVSIPISQKNIATSFTVVSGHIAPGERYLIWMMYDTWKGEEGAADWENLPKNGSTLVVLMGVRNLRKISEHLINKSYWATSTPVALIQSGTTENEKLYITKLSDAADEGERVGLKSPAIIVIGDVCTCLPQHKSYSGSRTGVSHPWGMAREA